MRLGPLLQAFALLAFVAGVWAGEGHLLADREVAVMATVAASALGLALFSLTQGHRLGVWRGLTVGGWLLLGLMVGQYTAREAYNRACVRSEVSRLAVLAWKERTGQFPEGLEQVPGVDPGLCWTRPPKLEYLPSQLGFEMRCSDGLVEWSGSEAREMTPRK